MVYHIITEMIFQQTLKHIAFHLGLSYVFCFIFLLCVLYALAWLIIVQCRDEITI